MWILTEEGNAINLNRALSVYSDNQVITNKKKVRVRAAMPDDNETIKIFDSKDEAKKFITDLVDELNRKENFRIVGGGRLIK